MKILTYHVKTHFCILLGIILQISNRVECRPSPSLFHEFNTDEILQESSPNLILYLSNSKKMILTLDDSNSGLLRDPEPFSTDLETKETSMLIDTVPGFGPYRGYPVHQFFERNDDFIVVTRASEALQIRKSDGTREGTQLMTSITDEITEYLDMSQFDLFDEAFIVITRKLKDQLTFEVETNIYRINLNGEIEDLQKLAEDKGTSSRELDKLGQTNTHFFYTIQTDSKEELWAASSSTNTLILSDDEGFGTYYIGSTSSTLFFALGRDLWKSDGTIEGTAKVADFTYRPTRIHGSFRNQVFFEADQELLPGITAEGYLWRSDGTTDGTFPISEFGHSHLPDYKFEYVGTFQGKDLVYAGGGIQPFALWDYTDPVTPRLVIGQFEEPDRKYFQFDSNNTTYFWINGRDFYSYRNGNLVDILENTSYLNIGEFLLVDKECFFTLETEEYGWAIWKTDGTTEGTALFQDFDSAKSHSTLVRHKKVNGHQLYETQDILSSIKRETLKTIESVFERDSKSTNQVNLESILYSIGHGFISTDGKGFYRLPRQDIFGNVAFNWPYQITFSSQRSPEENSLISFVNPQGVPSHAPSRVVAWDHRTSESVVLKEVSIVPMTLIPGVGDVRYFVEGASRLWGTDGTPAGTRLIASIDNESTGTLAGKASNPYFKFGRSANEEPILYTIDGDTGKYRRSIIPEVSETPSKALFKNKLYFEAKTEEHGSELWTYDLENYESNLFVELVNGRGGTKIAGFFPGEDEMAFFAYTKETGMELWYTDGTPTKTRLVKDIFPGPEGSVPFVHYEGIFVDGIFYFAASDPDHGHELWESDGTLENTVIRDDIRPGIGSSSPRTFVEHEGFIYFYAWDGTVSGNELWRLRIKEYTGAQGLYFHGNRSY